MAALTTVGHDRHRGGTLCPTLPLLPALAPQALFGLGPLRPFSRSSLGRVGLRPLIRGEGTGLLLFAYPAQFDGAQAMGTTEGPKDVVEVGDWRVARSDHER